MSNARRIGLLLGPALFLLMLLAPTPAGVAPPAWRTAALTVLMASWWLTEAIPIPATALVPLVLLPILGAGTIAEAAAPYANPVIFLFMGGFLIALASGWMSYAEMVDGEWKLHGLVSNIEEGQSAPGFQHTEMPAPHESAAMAAEGAAYFVTHFNAGHAAMVAERYAEDVVLIGAPEDGRAAMQANLQEMIDGGAQVTVTPFAAAELGDE